MSEAKTMIRTEVTVDGTSFLLSQDQKVEDLRRRIEAAVETAGVFVDMTVVGNRSVSVLVTPRTHVTISVATVAFDPRDTGDLDLPYGGYFDLV
ncbi:hypothetical protein [Microbacterium sp. NPDC089695]|uniref:hypothetical protein n=1 Tax=Microbacterium sp. NPDC089695 TaxID=3364198 RepID=UPI003805A106